MTKNPLKRLQTVIAQAAQQEREAAALLGKSQQQLTQDRAQLDALRRYQADYQKNWQEQGRQGQIAYQLLGDRRFLEQLQTAIDTQQKRVEHSQQQVEQAQNHWQQQHSRSEALGKLQSRYQNEAAQRENKREQRLQDEWAQRLTTMPFS